MSAPEQVSFLGTALGLLSRAIDAEDNHDYTEAYAQYMAALDYLMAAQQSETNEKSRTLLKMKADEYLNRAEAIKERMDIDTHKQLGRRNMAVDVSALIKSHTTAQSVILDEAFKCVKQAIDADASQNYVEAHGRYLKSMDYFMFAQRYELNEQSKSLIRSEVGLYLSRAETIKSHIDSLKSRAMNNDKLSQGVPRPPETVFLHTAIEITQRAIRQDGKKNYRSAYELYNRALDYYMLAQKYERDEQSKIAIRANMEEYLTRAEVLKQIV